MKEKFYVSDKQKKIWEIEKKILVEFMQVCDELNLKYFIAHGTLLGAVRHRGFIPWDDDIDVNMPREDFEKLKKVAQKKFQDPFFFQCYESDPYSFWGCAKLRYSEATGMDIQDIAYNGTNNGLFIDIFPMDAIVDDSKKLLKQSKKVEFYRKTLWAKIYGKKYEYFLYIGKKEWRKYKIISKLFTGKWLNKKFDEWVTKYNNCNTERSGIIAFKTDYECCYWYKKDYERLITIPFENLMVPAPENYDRCLQIKWKNYMEFPAESERGKKHYDVIFEPDIPYKKYDISKFVWNLRQIKEREIVLFGSGAIADEFYSKYGNKINISLILDNDKKKNNTMWHKKIINSPDNFIMSEKQTIIIVIRDFKEIEKQLTDMGIVNYYIFLPGRIYK